MTRFTQTLLAAALAVAAGPLAAQATAATATAAPSTAAPASAKPAAFGSSSDAQMGQMDEHMRQMQVLHQKLAGAATAEQRQALMAEQRHHLSESMSMMQGMRHGAAASGGAGTGMGAGMMGTQGKPLDTAAQMRMLEKRVDMMQVMMQTMLDQQGATGRGPVQPSTN